MKKTLSILLLVTVLVSGILTGCGSKQDQKTEEELRAEIEAEMRAEQEAEIESGKDNEAETDQKADMKDFEAIYAFVKKEVKDIPSDELDTWKEYAMYNFDITGDGTDEIIFAGAASATLNRAVIISGDSGEYRIIPSDIDLAKYENTPEFKDGFLTISWRTGGTGEVFGDMDFYVYNGSEMVQVLSGLNMYHMVSSQDKEFEETATIEGKLTDFIHTFTVHDAQKKTVTTIKKQYTYNPDKLSFSVKTIEEKDAGGNQVDDYTQGYTVKVSGGSLSITYMNTGKTITPVKSGQPTKVIWGTEQELHLSGVKHAQKNGDGSRLYYAIGPMEGMFPITLYIDMSTMKIHWINEGEYVMEAKMNGSTTYVVLAFNNESYPTSYQAYDLNGNFICDLGSEVNENNIVSQISEAIESQSSEGGMDIMEGNLTGFTDESIYGNTINYGEYRAVIVPMYPSSGKNMALLSVMPFIDHPEGTALNFAVFGKMENVKIIKYVNGEAWEEWELGELENTVLDISSNLPTDMSHYAVSGQVMLTNGSYTNIEFGLDDMRESSDYNPEFVYDEDYDGDVGW